jgi:phospholipid N-methyltransferase
VHHGCATNLRGVLAHSGGSEVDYIVSSVPLSILDDRLADEILQVAQGCLRPGGMFLQYQYSLSYRRRLTEQYGDVRLGFTLRNLPPAFVYECVNPPVAATA